MRARPAHRARVLLARYQLHARAQPSTARLADLSRLAPYHICEALTLAVDPNLVLRHIVDMEGNRHLGVGTHAVVAGVHLSAHLPAQLAAALYYSILYYTIL